MRTTTVHVLALACIHATTAFAQGLPHARPEEVQLSAAELERIGPALKAWVDAGRLAGVVAVVARHGKVAYRTSAGSLDPDGQRPIGEDAVFRIYSMTKPIATTAMMQLVEQGKVGLEDPVSKFIPAFANTKVYASGGAAHPVLKDPARPITIADLLTHTAGITYGLFGNTAVDSIYRQAGLLAPSQTIAQVADSIAHLPLVFSPGSAFNYSMAIDVVGRVVEVVSGMPFDQYLERAIFQPLAMHSTGFHATPAMDGRVTAVFGRGSDGKLHAGVPLLGPEFTPQGHLFSGGGGLLSTIPDYLRFAQMLLNGGELDGHRVLSRKTVALMMQNHLPAGLPPVFGGLPWPPGNNGFGYGGAVRLDSAASLPGSAGTFRWSGYASTFFWIDPKADLIAMVWSQYLPETHVWAVDGEFQRLVYAAVH